MFKSTALQAVLVASVTLGGCGPGSRGPLVDPSEALRGLKPRTDPPLSLDDDDDLARATSLFKALPENAPDRLARRKELWGAIQKRMERALAQGREDHAFVYFSAGLGLWAPHELRDRAPDLDMAGKAAELLRPRYTRGGSAKETITLLAVLIALHPEQAPAYQKEFDEIAAYLDDLADADSEQGARRPIGILESVIVVFPSPWVGETLVKRYLARHDALQAWISSGTAQDPRTSPLASHGPGVMLPVSNIVRAYALIERIDEARPVVEKLARNAFDEKEVRKYLEDALAPGAAGEDWLRLARVFLRDQDAEPDEQRLGLTTALRVCEAGAARLPRASEPRTCAGAVAADLRQTALSIRWLEEARRLKPDDFDVAEYLARLYDRRLRDFMAGERIDAGRQALAEMEKFHAEVKRRFPGKTLSAPLSDAYMTLAQGLFNVGEIDAAVVIWKKAAAGGAKAEATEQLAQVAFKRGRHDEAARLFEEAAALPRERPRDQHVDRARLLRLAGDAHEGAGRKERAKELWLESLTEWKGLVKLALDDEFVRDRDRRLTSFETAQVFLGYARVLYSLGHVPQAIQSFEQAIDHDREESSVYADAIAFLMTRGHFEPALDAYHRSLGRDEISEYFKVYTTIWVIDFAKLRNLKPDPLALEYLAGRDGTRWYHELARYRSGKITYAELLQRADTRGKRAEAYFYEAMAQYGQGKDEEAGRLLSLVVATDMLGFFEFDMARYFLDHGPPR